MVIKPYNYSSTNLFTFNKNYPMASKEKIHQLVDACENNNALEEVQVFLQQQLEKGDWWEDLSETEKAKTLASLQQADENKTISHQHLMEKVWAKFTK
jgi:hypothetical protein